VSNESGDGWSSGPWYASEPSTSEFPAYGSQEAERIRRSGPDRPPAHHGHRGGRGGRGGGGRRRNFVIIAIAGGLAIVAAIAVTVVMVTGNKGKAVTGFVPTGSSPDQDAQQITTAFLQAWETGNLSQAAHYTDQPAAALTALTSYGKYLHLRKLTGSTQSTTALSANATSQTRESAQFALIAKVATSAGADAMTGNWNYHSTLTAYQQKNSPAWYIAWNPAILAPNLTATQHLAAVSVPPTVTQVGDASGNNLTSYHDAGLTNIANLLEKAAPTGQGSPGLTVEIQTNTGKLVQNSQAAIIAPNNIPSLATTISPSVESAARSAVAMRKDSAMVAIQPSTGRILAIANNAGFNDFALTAAVAPGSAMKVITSTALISSGVLTAQSPVACPSAFTIQGITYHNDQGESEPAGTPFITDFAQSCNNAFTTQWSHLQGGGLAHAAKKYYGLDQRWDIGISGVSASYFNAPASASGSELAQEAFGEGSLVASPIAMASVAATVESGTFRQPILVPGTKQLTATPLPSSTDSQLHQMMQAVVTSGTAAGIGFGPGVYAKTGTADIQGQEQPNSWLIAFDPSKDVAVACLVVNAGYGAQFAGPEVKAFLDGF
jgi:Penicillin binding protein transpeptidase domain/NTF2-like N-terminal transpeptidase domain